jgi:CDP-diacylglycerol---serine O-phosphatidyltransferase
MAVTKRFPIIPTLVTLGNLACGIIAMGWVMKGVADPTPENFGLAMRWAGWMIMAAMVFDALDGKVARLAKATSEFGAQLDSLCDMVSFGVAPGLIILALAKNQGHPMRLVWATSIFFVMCVALRLARFNVETEEADSHDSFSGLPSPAGAAFVAGLVIIAYRLQDPTAEFRGIAKALEPTMDWMLYSIPFLAAAVGFLMISSLHYVHIMSRLTREREPLHYVVLLLFVAMLVIFTHPFSFAIIITAYVASGPLLWLKGLLFGKKTATSGDAADG